MQHLNIEIKARSTQQEKIRDILKSHNADFRWVDHQIDTYFHCNNGRLKLREWNIENHLIHYEREDKEWPKQSNVTLFPVTPRSSLKNILIASNGVLVVVDKKREIYFIDNVKFHIDTVESLWTFIEIEAIDSDGSIGIDKLQTQCEHYLNIFDITNEDLISKSYSDLLMEKTHI
jgi:predicted adenylyl cyclase CyaB